MFHSCTVEIVGAIAFRKFWTERVNMGSLRREASKEYRGLFGMVNVGRVLVATGAWSEMPMLEIFSDVVLRARSVVAKV